MQSREQQNTDMKKFSGKSARGRNFGRGQGSPRPSSMDKPNQYVNVVTNQFDEDEATLYEDHYLFTVRNAHKMSVFNLSLNNVCIEFLIESGASCNIITVVDYETVKHFVVLRDCNKLYPYGVKTPMKVRGKFTDKIESLSKKKVSRC